MIPAERIQERVKQIAQQITRDYQGRDGILMIGILKGAVVFMSDLIRHLSLDIHIDFMAVSSYGQSTKSSGAVRIIKDLDESVEGRHLVVVEDIVDTGLTLHYLRRNLMARRPASLRVCVLLDKPDRRQIEVPVDYTGFSIPDEFVVGYGLDHAGRYRHLPYIAVVGKGKRD